MTASVIVRNDSMGQRVNAVIVNGSARGTKGITHRLLNSFALGLADSKCTVHTHNLNERSIEHCKSCFHCMHSKLGVCSIKDDMADIYDDLKKSELLVIGTPLYTDTMSSRMKVFFDRCIPSMKPYIQEDVHGRFRHSFTWRMPKYFILVSTSGFPEKENFLALESTVQAQAYNFGSELVGSLCVPGSLGLQMEISLLEPHLKLMRQAGEEFGSRKTVSEDLVERINVPILSKSEFINQYSKYEAWCRKRLEKNT